MWQSMYVEWKVILSHISIALPHLKHRIAVQGGARMDFINLSDIFHIYEARMNPAFSRKMQQYGASNTALRSKNNL